MNCLTLCRATAFAAWTAMGAVAVAAQTSPPGTVPSQAGRIRFNIPSQPLIEALREYAHQARITVEVDEAVASNLCSTEIRGVLGISAALERLLDGTGLKPWFSGSRTVVVGEGTLVRARVYALTPLTVLGQRSRGYSQRSVAGTRTPTPLRDNPQSISLVTHQVIADQSMQSMSDVVRYTPGIMMGQGEGHRDAPTIRGNSTTADLFVDGVRDDAQYFRDLYNAAAVEVLKGSSALLFGRAGGGGILNRVTNRADWSSVRAVTFEGGSFDHKRGTLDLGEALSARMAGRLNGLYEKAGGFRDEAGLKRFGVNPSVAFGLGERTMLHAAYELFGDDRRVDRGLPSFQGRPSAANLTTFFGNPDSSRARLRMHLADVLLESRSASGIVTRNRTRFTHYDKFYQNSLPGAMTESGTEVNLSAYNNATDRQNVFNQTDVLLNASTGDLRHTLLAGAEVARQRTENFRETGYYHNTATTLRVQFDQPTISTPISFRQSATDANHRTDAVTAALFLQDQVALSEHWQVLGGIRYERFNIDFRDQRDGTRLERTDNLVSPHAGIVFKPLEAASVYASLSVTHLPSAGDQFSSLTATSRTLEPEHFTNYEIGAKWDVHPALSVTAAAYRLDRTNTSAPDPADGTRIVQTGSQRSTGLEATVSGDINNRWQIIAGGALQRAEITSTTVAAEAGAAVPLVPERTFSLWNRYQVNDWLAVGGGLIHQSDAYAAVDNTVTLPGFTRADAAVFLRFGPVGTAQLNVENVFDRRYYATSHGNNNIMPGAPRTLRFSLSTRR